MKSWHTLPEDRGKIVVREWIDAGSHGAICRVTDRSTPHEGPRYTIHEWGRGDFEPWNGTLGVIPGDGRGITAPRAAELLADD